MNCMNQQFRSGSGSFLLLLVCEVGPSFQGSGFRYLLPDYHVRVHPNEWPIKTTTFQLQLAHNPSSYRAVKKKSSQDWSPLCAVVPISTRHLAGARPLLAGAPSLRALGRETLAASTWPAPSRPSTRCCCRSPRVAALGLGAMRG